MRMLGNYYNNRRLPKPFIQKLNYLRTAPDFYGYAGHGAIQLDTNETLLKTARTERALCLGTEIRQYEIAVSRAAIAANNGGIEYLDHDLPKALSNFLDAAELAPNFALAHNNIGLVYVLIGAADQAIQNLSKALTIDQSLDIAFANRGIACLELGDYGAALRDFEAAIQLDPHDPMHHNNMGVLWLTAGYIETAMAWFDEAVRLDNNWLMPRRNTRLAVHELPVTGRLARLLKGKPPLRVYKKVPTNMELTMWNVQHGSAIHVRTPNGKHIVIDLGSGITSQGDEFSPLQYLWERGVRKVDLAIITHPHLDHISDIFNLDAMELDNLCLPWHLTKKAITNGYMAMNEEGKLKINKYFQLKRKYSSNEGPGTKTLAARNNGGVSIKTFQSRPPSTSNLNDHSIVTVLEYKGVKFLVPGDNGPPSWEGLLNRRDFRAAIAGTCVLVAPHHGRESGYYDPLFKHIQPHITLISDGRTVDTSATGRYSSKSRGRKVRLSDGEQTTRKCLTTRKDGHIRVVIAEDNRGRRMLNVQAFR